MTYQQQMELKRAFQDYDERMRVWQEMYDERRADEQDRSEIAEDTLLQIRSLIGADA